MKKLSFTFGIVIFSLLIAIGCKKKEKEGYTSTPEKNTEEQLALVTPINFKLPSDVLQSCVVGASDFKSWFKANEVSKNGIVLPANSVTFQHRNNCDFYRWSEQMFLWMTSPIINGDYSDGSVMESSVFYTVTPEVSGKRELIPHKKGYPLNATASIQKNDFPVDTEEGQATNDVLLSQKDSLVYYISMVNDVYAEFATAVKDKDPNINASQFPTTKAEKDSIVKFAAKRGTIITDADALAIEIKTSWVEAKTLSDPTEYIIIDAIVPTYVQTDSLWTPKGTRPAKLAMVGIHVVGSTDGHPEMVWATFEHKNNAPNLSYTYIDSTNVSKTVPADTGNDWLLNSDSDSKVYNQSHMTYKNDSIIAKTVIKGNDTIKYTISPSNTKMTKPWGVADAGVPNSENATVAASNSQVISINNSVLGKLIDGDLRKNYLFIGATWTDNGAGPDGTSYSSTNTKAGVAIGTSQLANSTMETYAQNGSAYAQYGSCFSCHHGSGNSLKPGDLSHIFSAIQPLEEIVSNGSVSQE